MSAIAAMCYGVIAAVAALGGNVELAVMGILGAVVFLIID